MTSVFTPQPNAGDAVFTFQLFSGLPTIGHPTTDNSTGAWTSTAATLAEVLDETTANDADYISVASASTYDFTLNNTAFPGGAAQDLKYRASSVNGSTLTVTLKQGGTTIMTRTHVLTPALVDYTQSLTAPEIALIIAGPISGTLTTS